MAGYAHRDDPATGTADPLEANLLLLEDSTGGRVLWISVDAVAVMPVLRDAIATEVTAVTAVRTEQIVCVASHTHAAPAGWVGTIHPGLPTDLDRSAVRAVATAIAGAAAGLAPVPTELSWAQGSVYGVGGNRHDPDGPTDQSVGILVVGPASEPVALLYDYACHPTVLGADNLRWSADWVGATRASLRGRLSSSLPVLFLQGCAGDQSTRFHRREQSTEEVGRLGTLVADAILAATPGVPLTPGPINVRQEGLALAVRTDDDHELLTADDAGGVPGHVDPRNRRRLEASLREGRRARLATINADLPAELTLPLSLVRIGDRAWLHTSVELYSAAGLRLRQAVPTLRVIGYTDDYHSYLADPDTVEANQYEAMSSFFDPEQTERFVTHCLALARSGSS